MEAISHRPTAIDIYGLPELGRGSRHDHTVHRFSRDFRLLLALRRLAVEEDGSIVIIHHICRLQGSPAPEVTFHGRRGPHTGYYRMPRRQIVLEHGIETLERWEMATGRRPPEHGMIRLGRRTSLGTIAHESGHHLVAHHEKMPVPPHGKLWVRWFDVAAAGIVDWIESSGLDPARLL